MTLSSIRSPRPDRSPGVGSRRARNLGARDRRFALALCVGLALLGLLPLVATLVVRSSWARGWAARETQRALREQGIAAAYVASLRVRPLAVELDDLRVQSTDGGAPALVSDRVLVRPKIFALMAGKLVIDEIDVDAPRLRVVVRGGRATNLPLPKAGSGRTEAFRAPFTTLSLTDGSLDLDVDGVLFRARSLDLDVTSDDGEARGSSFEIAVRAADASIHRSRRAPGGTPVSDDDALCSIEARGRIDPGGVLVRRLEAIGAADFDPARGPAPACAPDDERRVELSLGHVRVQLPADGTGWPSVHGHVRVRSPIALASRVAPLPDVGGWLALDADVRYAAGSVIPDVSGTLEAHDVRIAQYAFAQELHSDLTIRRGVVQSPKTTVRLAGGTVTLSDTVLDPLAGGGRLERTRLDAAGIDFTALLRDLGVHRSSWVGWDIRELHAPLLSGSLAPLKLDGDFTAKTGAFGVYDRPAEDRARERLFGFSEAQIAARLAIRPDALRFVDVHATLPHSRADGGYVSLGFNDDLRVDVAQLHVDLDDISPVGPVPMHGVLDASAHVGGVFARPTPEGDVKSAVALVVAGVQLGDLDAGHIRVDVTRPEVEMNGVRARRGGSPYEISSASLSFGGARGFVVDAQASSETLGLRDLLSMFSLDGDPRFGGLDAVMATRARVHVAVGGPEDACGSGFVSVSAKGHLRNVVVYGERFAQGDADVSLQWFDRDRGLAGADVDVRSFVLDKVQPPTTARGGTTGTVVGSATIRRGGALAANVAIEGVPLGRVDALGGFARYVEGTVSGVAHLSGSMDDFSADPGFTVRAGIDVTGTRVREVSVADSHFDVTMTHRTPRQVRGIGRSRCGAPVAPPFDKAAYLADTSSHGEWTIDGALLGGQLSLSHVVVTRARSPHLTGRASLRGLDLGALARIVSGARAPDDDPAAGRGSRGIGGQIWGELIVDDGWLDAPSKSRARLYLGPTIVSRAGQRLTLQPPREPLVLADDTLALPPLELVLDTPDGFRGGFQVTGGVARATSHPDLSLQARIEPIDLALLQKLVPRVERATGRVEGGVRITGSAAAPEISGEMHALCDELEVRGLPSAVTEVQIDVQARASQITASGTGKFAGGTVTAHAAVPIRGFDLGSLESRIAVRGVRLSPADGVAASVDGDLRVAYDPKAEGGPSAVLPHVTGDVTVGSLNYTRPITFNLDIASARAKRTLVNAYDPALDFVVFDVGLRSRVPLVIKNNLVEAQLAIDSGTIEASGTNQRIGLRGALRALPGGQFHFQGNDFDVQQALIRFDDPTRIDPNVDVTAVTEYRRYTDTSAGTSAGVSAAGGTAAESANSTQGGSLWRITMHAYGDANNVRIDLTSEPALAQDDIVLLLTVGMTRAELDQLQATGIGESVALNVIGEATGANRAVKQVIPIIDDFRFGSAYSTETGKTEPQLTVGKRLTNDLRASIQAGLTEDRELRANVEWRLNNRLGVQASYDNINDVSSSALGNLGLDLRWRLDFE